MVLNEKPYSLLGMGRRGYEGGVRGRLLYLLLHCHHQNDTCIKMSSDESHFNISLIVRDKVTRQHPETTIFEEKGELKLFISGVSFITIHIAYTITNKTQII